MPDDPSGDGDASDGRRTHSSAAEPDVGTAADSTDADSSERWGAPDRSDRSRPDDPADRDDRGDERTRIPLDLSGSSDGSDEDAAADDEYGPEANSTPIEPGDPTLENAVFVILGALAMVLVIARLVMIPLG